MKKYYVLLLMAMMGSLAYAQTPWDGTSSSWTKGEGTGEQPYLIETPQHLAYFSEQVRAGETYKGKFFRLANDLDMGADQGLKFTPIGFYDDYVDPENPGEIIEASKCFLGTFDGNYKKIDNIYVYFIDEQSAGGTGLFACIAEGTVIKNLGIGDRSTIEGSDLTGSIIGVIKGGIIQNCYNEGTISMETGLITGGIVGSGENGKIVSCYNRGMVTGTSYIAGIVGFADKNLTIENCYNNGPIFSTGYVPAGIVGYLSSGSVRNCYNAGMFIVDDTPYGVVGDTDPGVVIENCYFLADEGVEGKYAGITGKTEAEMQSPEFLAALNGEQTPVPWVADTEAINGGFPILAWQVSIPDKLQAVQQASDYRVYAVDGTVFVEYASAGAAEVIITDMAGRTIVDRIMANGDSVNIDHKGIYIVTVKVDGQQHIVKVAVK